MAGESAETEQKGEQKECTQTSSNAQVLNFVYFSLFLAASSLFMQNNCLPFLCEELGVGEDSFGHIQTIFSLGQLLGAPVFGRLTDIVGCRKGLALVYVGSAVFYGLHIVSANVNMLFLSQLPSVLMQAAPGCQILASQLTTSKERPGALGNLGMSIGLAIIVGPYFGGQITKNFGVKTTLLTAVIASLINAVLVLAIIPEKPSVPTEKDDKKSSEAKSSGNLLQLATTPGMPLLLWIKLTIGLPMGILQTMLIMMTVKFFNLSPDEIGLVMAFIGIMLMLVQAVGIGQLSKMFSKKLIIKVAAVCNLLGCSSMLYTTSIIPFCLSLVPIMGSTIVTLVLTDALVIEIVPDSQRGTALGICTALQAAAMTLGPTIGGWLMGKWGIAGFASFGATMSTILTVSIVSW